MIDGSGDGSTGVPQGSQTARIGQAAFLGGPPKSLAGVDDSRYEYEIEEFEEKATASR
jgi:hypothetical protein